MPRDDWAKQPYGERLDDNGEKSVVEVPLISVEFGGGQDAKVDVPILSGIKKFFSFLRGK